MHSTKSYSTTAAPAMEVAGEGDNLLYLHLMTSFIYVLWEYLGECFSSAFSVCAEVFKYAVLALILTSYFYLFIARICFWSIALQNESPL